MKRGRLILKKFWKKKITPKSFSNLPLLWKNIPLSYPFVPIPTHPNPSFPAFSMQSNSFHRCCFSCRLPSPTRPNPPLSQSRASKSDPTPKHIYSQKPSSVFFVHPPLLEKKKEQLHAHYTANSVLKSNPSLTRTGLDFSTTIPPFPGGICSQFHSERIKDFKMGRTGLYETRKFWGGGGVFKNSTRGEKAMREVF